MLNPPQIEAVRLVLATDGWNHVMKPAIAGRGREATKALILTRAERTEKYRKTDFDTEDDVLRAMIRDCEWMVVAWDNEVQIASHNRVLDELDGQRQSQTTANP